MEIEYTFANIVSPFIQKYEFVVPNPPDFSKVPVLDTLISLLRKQNVNDQMIETIQFFSEKEQFWNVANNDILPRGLDTKRLKLRIFLKNNANDIEDRLHKEIEELHEEIAILKKSIEELKISNRSQQSVTVSGSQTQNINNNDKQQLLQNFPLGSSSELTDSIPVLKPAFSMATPTLIPTPSSVGKRDTDIFYLYAVPIVKKDDKGICSLADPVDAYHEIHDIIAETRERKKDILIRIDVATFDRIRNALAMRPKILHISCHGGYEIVNGEQKLFLYLENNELDGIVAKYDVETFKLRFKSEIMSSKEIRPRLVFVSACYSQEVGEAIKQAGVPNVIAVNSDTQIADVAAIRFAKEMYRYLMLGNSVKEAFEKTKEDGRVTLQKLKLCCCSHTHKMSCILLEEYISNRNELHAKHICDCTCEYPGNIHSKNCPWVKKMEQKGYEVKPCEDNRKLVKVCCCRIDLKHNEEEKFVLISQSEEAQNERIFENSPEGELTVKRVFELSALPVVEEQIIGRNIELHKLLVALISPMPDQRIICVNGPKGVGKHLLPRTAAKYAIERGFFPDGVEQISLPGLTWLLSKLNSALLPPPAFKEARTLLELGQKVRQMKKLVLMSSNEAAEKNPIDLVKCLREVLAEGTGIKFILVAKKPMNQEHVVDINISDDLDPLSAYTIIKRKNPDYNQTYSFFENTVLARVLITPWLAKKAARLLKTGSEDEVYNKLLKENLVPQSGTENSTAQVDYIKSEREQLMNLKNKCEDMFPIYILAQMPYGLLESDFKAIYQEDLMKWKEKAHEYITESSEAQTVILCTKEEELKESKYKLAELPLRYINELDLAKPDRIKYQKLCLEALATMSRKIVRSFNINTYRQVCHDEFTAIVDEGIWANTTMGTLINVKGLPTNPLARFQIARDNFVLYLDQKLLEELISEAGGTDVEAKKIMSNIKELSLCVFTMLLHIARPQEALQVTETIQGFAANQESSPRFTNQRHIQKYYEEIMGIMALIRGGMTFKDSDFIGLKDAEKQVDDAEKLFRDAENDIGIGESLYIHALIQSKDTDRRKFVSSVFNDARSNFQKASYGIGIVRANIGEAFLIENAPENTDTAYFEKLLDEALEILEEKLYYDNMKAECFYLKAMCAEKHKDYSKMRESLHIALEITRCVANKCLENKCIRMLNHSSDMMQKDCPLFVFLKSFPIVKIGPHGETQALEPCVRKQSFFRPQIAGYFESKHVAIKAHFDTLTRESLKNALLQSCVVLQISSEFHSANVLNFEGPLGELDPLPLSELRLLLKDRVRASHCKILTIMIPNAVELGNAFVDLGIPHVICFRFHSSDIEKYGDCVSMSNLNILASSTFAIEFNKAIFANESVNGAFEKAIKSLYGAIQNMMEQLGFKNFQFNLDTMPVLLPPDPDKTKHSEKVISELKLGNYIETSPKRGVSEIEKERIALVGRQCELFRISADLIQSKCVNLYGKRGVGKTKLAKEVAYFMHMRSHFLSGIYYRGDFRQLNNPKYLIPSDEKISRDYSVLFIVDNMNIQLWKKYKHLFQNLRNERKYVFLLISNEPLNKLNSLEFKTIPKLRSTVMPELTEADSFKMAEFKLKPLPDKESLEFVISCLDQEKFAGEKSLIKLCPSRPERRKIIIESTGFKQANGYPKLLQIFSNKLIEGHDLREINLLRMPEVDEYFKRIIRHHDTFDTRFMYPPPPLKHSGSHQFSPKAARITSLFDAFPQNTVSQTFLAKNTPQRLLQEGSQIQPNIQTTNFPRPDNSRVIERTNTIPAEEQMLMNTEELFERQESGGWNNAIPNTNDLQFEPMKTLTLPVPKSTISPELEFNFEKGDSETILPSASEPRIVEPHLNNKDGSENNFMESRRESRTGMNEDIKSVDSFQNTNNISIPFEPNISPENDEDDEFVNESDENSNEIPVPTNVSKRSGKEKRKLRTSNARLKGKGRKTVNVKRTKERTVGSTLSGGRENKKE